MNAHTVIERADAAPATTEKPDVHAMVQHETVLSPRFYTTDFKALDSIDVSLVRKEWDELMAEMVSDPNKKHFKREGSFAGKIGRAHV